MAQVDPKCNCSGRKGVLQDFDPPDGIDQSHVKPGVRILAFRLGSQKFSGSLPNALHLTWREVLGGSRVGSAFLDFDEDHLVAVTCDDVNLTGCAAPSARDDDLPSPQIELRDTFLGTQARMI